VTVLEDLSWHELVEQLETARAARGDSGVPKGTASLVHELLFHQLELEMQNRELREAQERLEASRARYQELYDHAPVAYATLDARACIAGINVTGALLLGRERETLIGLPFVTAARVVDPGAFFAHLQSVFRKGRGGQFDIEITPESAPTTLQVTTRPRVDPGGAVSDCLVTMVDVSARKRIEDEKQSLLEREQQVRESAENANRMKDQFLGIVSHELRTPLTAFLGWTRILAQRPGEPALVARALEVMQRNGESLARIVDDLLDLSRIVNGKLGIEMHKVELEPAVRSSLELVRGAASAKDITLVESIAAGCVLTGDAERLQQVIWNLLANAIKFTPQGGRIDVVLERGGGGARLTIRDNGRGIDAATLPFVFDHFRQADSSSTRRHGGLGLGLAIAKHIVEAHGGRIAVESDGLDRGSTFTVDLPLRPVSVRPPPFRAFPGAAEMVPSRLANTRILLVDDDHDALEMLAEVLALWGAKVKTARSASEALRVITSFLPDALVSDLAMPGESGLELIERVRALEAPLSKVPAIVLSAHTREDDVRDALDRGFTRYLAKPIDLEQLAKTLTEVVSTDAARHGAPTSED
jgi:signal transduction histidine kinase/ActR/RegA family two-component response regulator